MNINPNIKASELIATTITGVRPFAYEIAEVNGTTVTLAKTNDPFKSDISFVYRTENCVGASLTKRAMELMGQGDIKRSEQIVLSGTLGTDGAVIKWAFVPVDS